MNKEILTGYHNLSSGVRPADAELFFHFPIPTSTLILNRSVSFKPSADPSEMRYATIFCHLASREITG